MPRSRWRGLVLHTVLYATIDLRLQNVVRHVYILRQLKGSLMPKHAVRTCDVEFAVITIFFLLESELDLSIAVETEMR